MAAAQGALPDTLVPAGVPIVVLRDPDAHPHARLRDGALVVRVRGGDEIGSDLVHALLHHADAAQGWSDSSSWRGISGWRRLLGVWWSPERAPAAFADPRGFASPAEDLATVAEAAWAPRAEHDADPLACRAPSKWAAVHALAGVAAPEVPCPNVAVGALVPENVESVELVFVAPTSASPASVSGHLLVAVRFRPDSRGVRRHTSFGLVADTTGVREGGLRYVVSGFTGAFPSRVRREPFPATAIRYALVEGRDVRRFRMRLDDDTLARVLVRLRELERTWDRPYLVTSRNCSALVIELADAAWGERPPAVISPEVLTAWMERQGWIEAIPPDRPEVLGAGHRAQHAAERRAAELALLSARQPGLHGVRRALDSRDPARRAEGYRALRSVLMVAPEERAAIARLVAWSDSVELDWDRQAARQDGRLPASDARAAHRALAGAVRRANGPGWSADVRAEEVEAAAARWSGEGRSHTPFRPVQLSWVQQAQAGAPWRPWLALSTPFYAGEMGGGRRFGQTPGMSLRLLDGDVRLPLDAVGPLQGRLRLGSMRSLDRLSSPRRLGLGLGLLDVWSRRDGERRTLADWAWVEGLWAVAADDQMANHILLSVGVSATSWRWQASQDLEGWRAVLGVAPLDAPAPARTGLTGVGIPVGLQLRLGRQRWFPLEHATVSLRRTEAWSPGRGRWSRAEGRADLAGLVWDGPKVGVAIRGWGRAWTDPVLGPPLAALPGAIHREIGLGVELERW